MGMEVWALGVVVVLGLGLLWAVSGIGNTLTLRARARGSAKSRARRHFINAAQLVSEAKAKAAAAAGSGGQGSLGKQRSGFREAIKEADAAIALDPRDAAAHIVKGLALEALGQPSAALRCVNMALAPPAARSLAPQERADALAKRAAMLLDQSRGKKSVQAAIADLEESAGLQPGNAKVLCALGACYERRGLGFYNLAVRAYQRALDASPGEPDALAGVERLRALLAPGSRRPS